MFRFNGTIALSAANPTDWSTSLSASPVDIKYNLAGSSTLAISVPSDAAVGKYTVTVTGTSDSLIHSTDVIVQVIKPDFSISSNPSILYLAACTSSDIAVKVQSLNRFYGTVSISPTLPTGWTSNLAQPSLTVHSGTADSTVLSISVPSNAPTGTYAITITGTSNTLTHPTSLKVVVK